MTERHVPTTSEKLRVCFICTGNRARSPIAAQAFKRAAGDFVDVDSAGILELDAAPPLPEAVAAAAKHGLDITGHRSKTLTSIDPDAFDLFIGFELDHIAYATVEMGIPHAKVFTFSELVKLLDREPRPGERASGLREIVAHRQSRTFDVSDQLADPLGRSQPFFDDTADRIVSMCRKLAQSLAASGRLPR